jgi:DNA polymerase-3 subunit gamma/tau
MAYTVLARRYRSQTFDDVVGQDAAAQTLKNAIESGRVAHAYLFTGTRGVGKTTMARILAKSLNCLKAKGPTVKPCLKCDSCVSINTGEDLDVIEIDGASNNSVDNIRELRQNAIYRPARSRYKIYIIDEVHMLTTSAFNALLKILEEPPDHVKFIFATTEPNKVLPTIQSRCQRFDFANIHHETIAAQLRKILKEEKIKFEDDLIIHLSRLANGSMRDALSLLDQLISAGTEPLSVSLLTEILGQPDRKKLHFLAKKIADQDGAGVLDGAAKLIEGGQSAIQICDCLSDLFRDLMVLKASGKDSKILILTESEREELASLAEGFDLAGLVYAITALEKLRWTIKNSECGRILLEAALLRFAMQEHFLGLDQLASPSAGAGQGGLKKNGPLNETPPSRPENPPTPRTVQTEGPLTLDIIRQHWQEFLAYMTEHDGAVANYITRGTLSGFSKGVLTLQFPENASFALQACKKRQADISASLQSVFGQEISLAFEEGGAVESPTPKPPRTAVPVDRRERAGVLDDPKVQMILKELNATPMDIQKLSEEEEGPEPAETEE